MQPRTGLRAVHSSPIERADRPRVAVKSRCARPSGPRGAPWSDQLPCEKRGGPAIRVVTNGARHALVITHPDGRRCVIAEGPTRAVGGDRT